MKLVYTVLLLHVTCTLCQSSHGGRAKALMEDLLGDSSNYSANMRPVKQPSESIKVEVEMLIHQIIELNGKEEYMKTIAWFFVWWMDELLTWNPKDYGGIQDFHIPASSIWRPDLLLYNSVDENKGPTEILADTNAVVRHTGEVKWMTSGFLKTSCKFDVTMYPFDTQKCTITLGSWTYRINEVNLTCGDHPFGINRTADNCEWDLLEMPCSASALNKYTDINFMLVVKRKPLFYLYNLLFPTMLLCILGILVFVIPPESGEKTSIAVTVLLAMTVFLFIVMDHVPSTSDVIPLLDKFIGAVVGILAIVTILSIILTKCYYIGQKGHRPPRWMRKFVIQWLSKIVFIHPKSTEKSNKPYANSPNSDEVAINGEKESIMFSPEDHNDNPRTNIPECNTQTQCCLSCTTVLNRLLSKVDTITEHLDRGAKEKSSAEDVQTEWTDIAYTLDRTCLLVFTIVVLALLMGLFI